MKTGDREGEAPWCPFFPLFPPKKKGHGQMSPNPGRGTDPCPS